MLRVLETFSGIGAQAKALERLNIDYEILATADWDVNAIMAYDFIHNGTQDLSQYDAMTKQELMERLRNYTLSPDGKEPYKKGTLERTNIKILRRLLCAIERTNNLGSITDMTYEDIPENLDLLTYSFPCQDLSIAGVWHGNMTGIDRNANNRSGMLWEVERLLVECVEHNRQLPQFLLMENVSNILAPRHRGNFQEWIDYLSEIGYYSQKYKLNASKFGIPQNRQRVYMLSVYIENSEELRGILDDYFANHNLEDEAYAENLDLNRITVENIVKNNYENEAYMEEANRSQMHDTPSRVKIVKDNDIIYENNKYIDVLKTITTKQDRNPNSGVIQYSHEAEDRLQWRYLTPRECFIAMGFDEADFESVDNNNINVTNSRKLFSDNKLVKMAGNSIVVNVLEAIFSQVVEIKAILEDV